MWESEYTDEDEVGKICVRRRGLKRLIRELKGEVMLKCRSTLLFKFYLRSGSL